MEFHVNRGGSDLGRHSLEQLRQGLASGLYFATDLVWREGMEKWLPLGDYVKEWDLVNAGERPSPVAWERRKELGFWSALFKTLQDVLFDPVKAFRGWKADHDLAGAFFFALFGGGACSIISAVYQLPFQMAQMTRELPGELGALGGSIALLLWLLAMVVMIPFLVVVGVIIGAGLAHLALWMLGGAKRGFETTLRVTCYATGPVPCSIWCRSAGGWWWWSGITWR
ncbi:MAG: DUF4339 domain-containing protein [Bdellovibrionaceae bacterium]|nr:DUF4339 domain-containing protein [Pseudobdellovibrionaceae bacterium]